MLWMETYCFYCSVRLGVIVSATLSFFHALIFILLLVIYGSPTLKSTKLFLERDEQHTQDPFLKKILDNLSERPQSFIITFDILLSIQMVASAFAVYGSFKLQKTYLLPYMVIEFVIFVGALTQHVITMVLLKKIVNLGILIALTLAGGFYILFIGYSWAGAVALFQIIVLINSQKYKALYGEDPMSPRTTRVRNDVILGHGTIENVKIFLTPNNNEINAIKRKRLIEEQQQQRFGRGIISVRPVHQVDKNEDIEALNFNNWHWNELVGAKRVFK